MKFTLNEKIALAAILLGFVLLGFTEVSPWFLYLGSTATIAGSVVGVASMIESYEERRHAEQ